jgi:hypothetical protein
MRRSSNRATGESTANSYQELFTLLGDNEDQAARRRTAAKIATGEMIDNIDLYVFGVARFVRLESYRRPEMVLIEEEHHGPEERAAKMPDALTVAPRLHGGGEDGSESVMQGCLRECLEKLDDGKRRLILAYYDADETSGKQIEHRRQLAERYKKTAGALQKQICLLRQKVSNCSKECVRRELG